MAREFRVGQIVYVLGMGWGVILSIGDTYLALDRGSCVNFIDKRSDYILSEAEVKAKLEG